MSNSTEQVEFLINMGPQHPATHGVFRLLLNVDPQLTFAAGGEAYMTGELAVCAGTCGPGSLHFVNGIHESHRNGAPVLLIASDVARTESGFNFPQEVDQKKIYEQHSHFCEYISHPSQARRIMAKVSAGPSIQKLSLLTQKKGSSPSSGFARTATACPIRPKP